MSASLVRATVRAVSKRKLQPTRAALTLVSGWGARPGPLYWFTFAPARGSRWQGTARPGGGTPDLLRSRRIIPTPNSPLQGR